MMIEAVKSAVKMPDGKFIKTWDYSQGEFSCTTTADIFHGAEISEDNYKTFFKKRGGIYLIVDLTAIMLVKEI